MNKYLFDPNIPPEIKLELERFLLPLSWLVPDWCQQVHIRWSDESAGDGAIRSNTMYEYRSASLTFYPCWHTQSDAKKQGMVIHDLLHTFTCPAFDYATKTIESLIPESEAPKFREHVIEELRMRTESTVQDLAHCINRRLTTA